MSSGDDEMMHVMSNSSELVLSFSRAVIPAEYIKPITTDLKSLTIKKTGGKSGLYFSSFVCGQIRLW